jgi:hypothetical protein
MVLDLQLKTEDPSLWNDPTRASKILKKLADVRAELESWKTLQKRIADTSELIEIAD